MSDTYSLHIDHGIEIEVEIWAGHDESSYISIREQDGSRETKVPLSQMDVLLFGDEAEDYDTSRANLIAALEALLDRVKSNEGIRLI